MATIIDRGNSRDVSDFAAIGPHSVLPRAMSSPC
jgi:hypothetical protein